MRKVQIAGFSLVLAVLALGTAYARPMVVTMDNYRLCKSEIWISNGVGFEQGRNCAQGKTCCDDGQSLTVVQPAPGPDPQQK